MAASKARLLLVSYYVPPRFGVGTRRSEQLIKHLPEFGWDVRVLTARFDEDPHRGYLESRYVDVRESVKRALGMGGSSAFAALQTQPPAFGSKPSLKQRIITLGFNLTTYPDAQVGWIPYLAGAIRSELKSGQYDVLLTSAPPFSANIAVALSNPPIPWVADMRDPWANTVPIDSFPLRPQLDRFLEFRTLQRAAAFTAASQPMAAHFGRRLRKPYHGITNAFDAREWNDVPFDTADRCTFVYAGQLYRGRLDPSPLFSAVRRLLDAGRIGAADLAIDFYCTPSPWLRETIERYGLSSIVSVHAFRSREEIMHIERRADRLLLFLWDGLGSDAIIPGKVFEYLGARRRMLAVSGPVYSAVDDVLSHSAAGTRVRDETATAREVLLAVNEYRERRTRIVDQQCVAPYEAREMARQFDGVLRSVMPAGGAVSTNLPPVVRLPS